MGSTASASRLVKSRVEGAVLDRLPPGSIPLPLGPFLAVCPLEPRLVPPFAS